MFFSRSFDIINFKQYLMEKKNLTEGSMYNYVVTIEKFLNEGYDPEKLEDYNNFLIKYAIKKRSTYYYSVLKTFIHYKIKDKSMRMTILENLITPEIPQTYKKERKYLEEEQIINLINNLQEDRHKIISLIQFLTGIRTSDVLHIRRGDIIPELYEDEVVLKIIVEGKGKKRNVIYIHDELIQILIIEYLSKNFIDKKYYFLKDLRRQKNNDFPLNRIYRSNYIRYYRDLKASMYRTGISFDDFATHDYRRCYARRVWIKYKDLQILKDLLNHSNPSTTMLYLKHSGLKNIDYHRDMQI